MKKRSALVMVLGIAVIAAAWGALSQKGEDLFQKALRLERNEGKLAEAIALYQKVIEETKDESLAANAQLRIGFCYEKQGREEARKAFQTVLDKYPNQLEAVNAAREKLSSLLKAQITGETGAQKFNIRPLWTDPGLDLAFDPRPSPDGKLVSFTEWSSGWGEIAIREMATGKIRYLTKYDPAEKDEGKMGDPYSLRWSPDGRYLAYAAENTRAGHVDLRIMGLDEPEPRTLHRVKSSDAWIEPADWSRDGKEVLFILTNDGGNKFGLIPSTGGSARFLRKLEGIKPGGGLFSPDGKYIAYSAQTEPDNINHDLFLYSLEEEKSVSLAPHPSHDYLLGWTPDGSGILFTSDRTGSADLWIVPVEKGSPGGDPSVLMSNMGYIESLGLLGDGSFFFNRKKWSPTWDIYTLSLDPETGRIEAPPTKIPLPYEGSNLFPAWSPDGKYIVYSSSRGRPRRRVLCLYSVETGKVRELSFKQEVTAGHWSPDGRFVLVHEARWSSEIFKVDQETGEISSFIKTGDKQEVHSPNISPDMNFLYYAHSNDKATVNAIVRRDIKTGEEKEIYASPWYCASPSLSPDGERIAFFSSEDFYAGGERRRILKVMASSGGDVKDLYECTQTPGSGIAGIDWSPDGRFIYFLRKEPEKEGRGRLWRIPSRGGQAQKLDVGMLPLSRLSVHPDGRQIAFDSHPPGTVPLGSYWIMENFLPGAGAEGKGMRKREGRR